MLCKDYCTHFEEMETEAQDGLSSLAKIITNITNVSSKATAPFSTKVSSIATMHPKLLKKVQFPKFSLIVLWTVILDILFVPNHAKPCLCHVLPVGS